MMRRCCLGIVFLLAVFTACDVHAQLSNPPFQNPSLDSNCFFPQIGTDIDTIYGSSSNEGLGGYIHNLGPKPDGTPGTLLIGRGPVAPFANWSEVTTGPTFNLHDLQAKAQQLSLDPTDIRFGHFHNRTNVDILSGRAIYWADADGNYDPNRKTSLDVSLSRRFSTDAGGVFNAVAPMSSDTVDDIVMGLYILDSTFQHGSLFLIQFRGGAVLSTKDTAYEDTSELVGSIETRNDHWTMEGDYRGTGRKDFLISDESDKFVLF